MTVTAPALHWYELETGVYVPDYFVQLDTCVRALCAANAVTAPSATVTSQLPGGYLSAWMSQTDTAVRALCSALSVTPPVAMLAGQTFGQLEATYPSSLDVAVRALCNVAPGYTGPLDLTATPAVVAYGQRALSAAKLGSAVYAITRTSDGTTQTFNSDAVTGAVSVSAIQSFIGAGRGYAGIAIDSAPAWIDQSATGADLTGITGFPLQWNVVSATVRPGCGGAAPTDDDPGQGASVGGLCRWSAGAPATIFYVAYLDPGDTSDDDLFLALGVAVQAFFELYGRGAALRFIITDNSGIATTWSVPGDHSGLHIYEIVVDASGNLTVLVDGIDQNASITDGSLQALSAFTFDSRIGVPANADFTGSSSYAYEGLLFPALSPSDRAAIRANMKAWYGTP